MTTINMAIILGVIIALICLIDAKRWNAGKQTLYRFFLLDGKLKINGFVSTILAANLSLGNFLIFIATWGYLFGSSGLLWFVINLGLNVIGFRLFFPHFKSYIEDNNNSGTIHDYLSSSYAVNSSKRISAFIRLSASLVTVIGLLLAIVFELSIAVSLISPSTHAQQITIFLSLTTIICVFTAYGGFRTLVVSDICQASLLAIATIALLIVMLTRSGLGTFNIVKSFTSSSLFSVGWPNIVSICIIGTGWLLVAMDQWQRTCAARSYDTSKRGVTMYLILISFFALVFGIWGFYDKDILLPSLTGVAKTMHSQGNNPLADIRFLAGSNTSQNFIITFITCGLIGAGLSTTNTFLTVSSHSLTTDVLLFSIAGKKMQELDETENKVFISIGRSIIIGIGVLIILVFVGLVSWGLLKDPLSFFFIAYSIQFALLAPMVMSRVKPELRPTGKAVIFSLFLGLSVALIEGIGSWYLTQINARPILGIQVGDWLTLTPIVCFLFGVIPLIISIFRRKLMYRSITND